MNTPKEWEENLNCILFTSLDLSENPERPMKTALQDDLTTFISTLIAKERKKAVKEAFDKIKVEKKKENQGSTPHLVAMGVAHVYWNNVIDAIESRKKEYLENL